MADGKKDARYNDGDACTTGKAAKEIGEKSLNKKSEENFLIEGDQSKENDRAEEDFLGCGGGFALSQRFF